MLNRLICLILGYFIGAIIQTGFWIGKFNHIDIRDYGSGNAGTTNPDVAAIPFPPLNPR